MVCTAARGCSAGRACALYSCMARVPTTQNIHKRPRKPVLAIGDVYFRSTVRFCLHNTSYKLVRNRRVAGLGTVQLGYVHARRHARHWPCHDAQSRIRSGSASPRLLLLTAGASNSGDTEEIYHRLKTSKDKHVSNWKRAGGCCTGGVCVVVAGGGPVVLMRRPQGVKES